MRASLLGVDERGGTVFIVPVVSYLPSGRLVDPATSSFWVHWEDWDDKREEGVILADGGNIEGADAAIAWGRERCDRILIRLGRTPESHFSAGYVHLTENTDGSGEPFPVWPPDGIPPEGWWSPSDEAAAMREAIEQEARYVDPGPPGSEPRNGD
jgi:hypothetical protein